MRIGVLHFMNVRDRTSSVASTRIAWFVYKKLLHLGEDVVLVDSNSYMKYKREYFDVLLIVNSVFRFCNYKDEFIQLVNKAKRVVWIENDYANKPPSQINNIVFADIWSNREKRGQYINWNQLTYKKDIPKTIWNTRFGGLFYYGAFREGRVKQFKKYLRPDLYTIQLSSKTRNRQKFVNLLGVDNVIYYEQFTHIQQIGNFQTSIYMGDKQNHTEFHSLANRFYECLSIGVGQLIESESEWVFKRQGMVVRKEWVVSDAYEIRDALQFADKIAESQQELWSGHYDKKLHKDFIKVWDTFKMEKL